MSTKNKRMDEACKKVVIAEFVATFMLVFCGTEAIIINQEAQGMLSILHLVYLKPSVESGLIGVVVGAVVGLETLFAGSNQWRFHEPCAVIRSRYCFGPIKRLMGLFNSTFHKTRTISEQPHDKPVLEKELV